MLNFIENLLIRIKVQQVFETTIKSRNMILEMLQNYTLEQLNKIPPGFNNNLIWNIGHIIVAQQVLVYKLSALPMMIADEMVEKYKNGSRPKRDVTETELEEIKKLLLSTINKTTADYNNGIFKTYNEYTTSIGFNLKNVEEAIAYNNFHEGLHIGIMMTLRKFI
ncbi:DinB family protein [Flavobacterium sufflavum]|uniref:DinB family protein n=1 Tax=Flavobacterium sufflavum TaxID=1921138 RepID=A0A3S2V6A6_9FLAO|nr:DinB family protein [Flavobacterium sufflavum]RVT78240.1 DinB family protein [Flavobacterium sufflavum]